MMVFVVVKYMYIHVRTLTTTLPPPWLMNYHASVTTNIFTQQGNPEGLLST